MPSGGTAGGSSYQSAQYDVTVDQTVNNDSLDATIKFVESGIDKTWQDSNFTIHATNGVVTLNADMDEIHMSAEVSVFENTTSNIRWIGEFQIWHKPLATGTNVKHHTTKGGYIRNTAGAAYTQMLVQASIRDVKEGDQVSIRMRRLSSTSGVPVVKTGILKIEKKK